MSIMFSDSHEIDLDQLTALFNSVGWARRTADREYAKTSKKVLTAKAQRREEKLCAYASLRCDQSNMTFIFYPAKRPRSAAETGSSFIL